MNTQDLTQNEPITQGSASQVLVDYFSCRRADCIKAYREARFWPDRISARSQTLHYGSLIRKFEVRL